MKKNLIIILAIIILGIGAYFGIRYFGLLDSIISPNQPPPNQNNATDNKITPISQSLVFDYWTKPGSSEIYFISVNGQINKISQSGEEINLSSQTIQNLNWIKPSFNGSLLLVAFGSASNPAFSIFDIEKTSWQPLDLNTKNAAWEPAAKRLAYIKEIGSASSINILDLSTNKSSEIVKFSGLDLNIDWVLADKIYLTQKSSAQFSQSLWSLNIKTKELKPIIKDEPGLMVLWSKNGELGLKFNNALKENQLSLIDKDNQIKSSIKLVSLPSKCLLENQIVYCAAPKNLSSGVLLPDDYLKSKVYFLDNFFSWNIETGVGNLIFESENFSVDATRLSKHNNRILFLNRYDKKLYSLGI